MKYDFLAYLWRSETWIAGSALVAFLVATWVLRGAPPGQAAEAESDSDAPTARYRDRIVAAVVVGMILILLGAFVAVTRGIPWSLPIFGAGLGLVLLLISYNRRYRHASPSLRRTIEFSGAFLNATLLAGILIVGNIIAFRYGGQPIDVTREQTYSLSSMTHNQLKSLQQPVTFTMVFGRGPRAVRQRERVVQLLESYKAVSPALIELVSIDPYSDPTRNDDLVKRVPELELLSGGGVVIEYGEGEDKQHAVVRNGDLFQPLAPGVARGGTDQFASAFTGEDEITSALIRLREGKRSKVVFTTGHGEPATNDLNPRSQGVGNWKTRLSKVGCEVIELNLIQDDIPPDTTTVIVVSPKSPFKPDEEVKLRAFAEHGGPVLLLLGNSEPSGLDEFLKSFNLALGSGLVIDSQFNYNHNVDLVWAPTGGTLKHAVIDPLGSTRGVLLPRAAPIHIFGQSVRGQPPTEAVNPKLIPATILQTTNYSWAEKDPRKPPLRLDPTTGDEPGPLTVGVAVSDRLERPSAGNAAAGKPRLVLFASSGMAENRIQEIEQTNLDLLMNAASWLRNRPDTQGIAPHTHVALTLAVDPGLRSRLILVPTVVAVMLIIALGISVYMIRRQ
jgi:ABC-type uncharacterized transport system